MNICTSFYSFQNLLNTFSFNAWNNTVEKEISIIYKESETQRGLGTFPMIHS